MKDLNQNPNQEKAREYDEIQKRATESGHLEGIHTHESHDAREVMDNEQKAPLSGNNDNATPGQGRGVEGTGGNMRGQ
jgi:hypothetical protein